MNKIQYKGAIYIRSGLTPHKKCAKGTHWNETNKKCLKLSPALSSHIAKVNSLSHSAKSKEDHNSAAAKHQSVSHKLKQKGFEGLGHKHHKKVINHKNQASQQPGGKTRYWV